MPLTELDRTIESVLLSERLWKKTVIRIPRGTVVRKSFDAKLRYARYLKKKLIKQHKK
ncbi:hypothetical protein LCGC14_3074670, partial [marine sediment metagenome]